MVRLLSKEGTCPVEGRIAHGSDGGYFSRSGAERSSEMSLFQAGRSRRRRRAHLPLILTVWEGQREGTRLSRPASAASLLPTPGARWLQSAHPLCGAAQRGTAQES